MGAEYDACSFQLFRGQRQQLLRDKRVLSFSVCKGPAVKEPGIFRACPEGFFNAVPVFADQDVPRLQDGAAAAVIGGQIDPARDIPVLIQMEILQKTFHHERVGSAESVDGLVVIPHYEKIVVGSRKQEQSLVLGGAHVLEFIDQNPAKTAAPPGPDVRPAAKQVPAAEDHVVKVQAAPASQVAVVIPDQCGKPWLKAGKSVFVTADQKLQLFHGGFFGQTKRLPLGPGAVCKEMVFPVCPAEVRPDFTQMPEIFVFFILSYDTEPLPGGFLQDSVKN